VDIPLPTLFKQVFWAEERTGGTRQVAIEVALGPESRPLLDVLGEEPGQ
jgi:hypothetical protein